MTVIWAELIITVTPDLHIAFFHLNTFVHQIEKNSYYFSYSSYVYAQ